MIRLIITISAIVIAILFTSCDAPRLNPLDPQSPAYNIGQLDGYVFSYPRDPLPGARVTFKEQNLSVITDINGYYKIEKARLQNGIVYIEKEGFKKDSILVVWNNQKNIRLEERRLDYTIGKIKGIVRASAPSLKALQNVKVLWKNNNILTSTNKQGEFVFENTSYESGWLFFETANYSIDSFYVEFSNQREESKDIGTIYLNSIPMLHDFKIFTSVENRYPEKKTYRMEVHVNISDDEGEIDSVFINCDELKFSKLIRYNLTTRNFEGSFTQSDMNLFSMEEAIGKNFYIIVKDLNNKSFVVGFSNVKRVINQIIAVDSPINGIATSTTPILKWQKLQPGFNFYYSVQIFTDEVSPILMWDKDNISKDDFQCVVDTPLSAGDYYWVVWCVDDYGNKARSFLATFSVR